MYVCNIYVILWMNCNYSENHLGLMVFLEGSLLNVVSLIVCLVQIVLFTSACGGSRMKLLLMILAAKVSLLMKNWGKKYVCDFEFCCVVILSANVLYKVRWLINSIGEINLKARIGSFISILEFISSEGRISIYFDSWSTCLKAEACSYCRWENITNSASPEPFWLPSKFNFGVYQVR